MMAPNVNHLEFDIVKITIRPKNLKAARIKSGMTLRELSAKCGLSIGFLNDLEWNRRTCSQKAFDKINEALA